MFAKPLPRCLRFLLRCGASRTVCAERAQNAYHCGMRFSIPLLSVNPPAISWWSAPECARKAYGQRLHLSSVCLSRMAKAICGGAAPKRRGYCAAHHRGPLLASSRAAGRIISTAFVVAHGRNSPSSIARGLVQPLRPNPAFERTCAKSRAGLSTPR